MKKYTIYLGLTTQDGLVKIPFSAAAKKVQDLMTNTGLAGATIYSADGVWQNGEEKSLVADFIAGDHVHIQNSITEIAKKLKTLYNQQSVLITSQNVEIWEA